ncbi:MAG: IclR family transcriptional regulator [Spirochaetes bacterium]|nr:IclR family transcriptional regulator [Spirochaetota bacterium]
MPSKTKSQSDSPGLIQSIHRAASILELFLENDDVLGISDFSERLNLPKTTVQGIVKTLTALNYLAKDSNSAKYRLGPVLLHLGFKYAKNMDLLTESMVWIERLSFKFNMTVNVCIRVGDKVFVLYCVEPKDRFSTYFSVGASIDIHTTAAGKILYAFLDKKQRDEMLKDYEFVVYSQRSIGNLKDFNEELDRVRKEGISFSFEEGMTPTSSIGGPIFNDKGNLLAAFAVIGNPAEIQKDLDEIIYEVKNTSLMISKRLGYMKGSIIHEQSR